MKIDNSLIQILSRAGLLKEIKRTGWVLKGVKDVESVADHTWRMSFLVLMLTPKKLDKQKVLEMCIIHDLGEIGIGDIKWETGKKVISSKVAKHKDELSAMEQMFGDSKEKRKYVALLREFNELKTAEAKFLKQIDKLEMVLTALEYEKQGYNHKLFDEFWENAQKYIVGGELEEIFNYLKGKRI